jgi:hypothetical protein
MTYSILIKLFTALKPRNTLRLLLRLNPKLGLERKIEWDVFDRPHFAYGVYRAAWEAKKLGLKGITVIEFGVAGGSGLVILEKIAAEVAKHFSITIKVVGFDTGSGMPRATDYRDLPHIWQPGFFKMDVEALQARLKRAELIIGNVTETIAGYAKRQDALPIGFISFDLDYYSSTVEAFRIFEEKFEVCLPRVYCYFDDVVGNDCENHSDFVGELLAIKEFNERHETRKIGRIHLLRHKRRMAAIWNDKMYLYQDFEHPHATDYIGATKDRQLPLK